MLKKIIFPLVMLLSTCPLAYANQNTCPDKTLSKGKAVTSINRVYDQYNECFANINLEGGATMDLAISCGDAVDVGTHQGMVEFDLEKKQYYDEHADECVTGLVVTQITLLENEAPQGKVSIEGTYTQVDEGYNGSVKISKTQIENVFNVEIITEMQSNGAICSYEGNCTELNGVLSCLVETTDEGIEYCADGNCVMLIKLLDGVGLDIFKAPNNNVECGAGAYIGGMFERRQ